MTSFFIFDNIKKKKSFEYFWKYYGKWSIWSAVANARFWFSLIFPKSFFLKRNQKALSWSKGLTCWISFAPLFSFIYIVLVSPYLCFIAFLYLDLYVLGDDTLISYASYMQTKYICVLINILTKGELGAPWYRFKPSSKYFTDSFKAVLLLWTLYAISVLFFVMLSCASVS